MSFCTGEFSPGIRGDCAPHSPLVTVSKQLFCNPACILTLLPDHWYNFIQDVFAKYFQCHSVVFVGVGVEGEIDESA